MMNLTQITGTKAHLDGKKLFAYLSAYLLIGVGKFTKINNTMCLFVKCTYLQKVQVMVKKQDGIIEEDSDNIEEVE